MKTSQRYLQEIRDEIPMGKWTSDVLGTSQNIPCILYQGFCCPKNVTCLEEGFQTIDVQRATKPPIQKYTGCSQDVLKTSNVLVSPGCSLINHLQGFVQLKLLLVPLKYRKGIRVYIDGQRSYQVSQIHITSLCW